MNLKSIEGKNLIKFYRATGKYGFLPNLYKKPIIFEGREFPSAEHAYQFGKFRDEDTREWAMKAPKPHLLAILAHGLFSWDIVKDWSKIKVPRMHNVLRAKFSDRELMYKLLDTRDSILIENSKTDAFWGTGRVGKGKNMLGLLLMRVREEIKKRSGNIDNECGFMPSGWVPVPREDLGSFSQLDDVKDNDIKDHKTEVTRKK